MQRFRPNIVVQGTLPWEEDTWKRIRIGGMEFHVWQRCGRCAMTTIDRTTLERGPEPLATLSTFREREKGQRNFGMHMIPVKSKSNNNASMEYQAPELSLIDYPNPNPNCLHCYKNDIEIGWDLLNAMRPTLN